MFTLFAPDWRVREFNVCRTRWPDSNTSKLCAVGGEISDNLSSIQIPLLMKSEFRYKVSTRLITTTYERLAIPAGTEEALLIVLQGQGRDGPTMSIHNMAQFSRLVSCCEEIDMARLFAYSDIRIPIYNVNIKGGPRQFPQVPKARQNASRDYTPGIMLDHPP